MHQEIDLMVSGPVVQITTYKAFITVFQGIRQDGLLQDCETGGLKKTFPDIDYSFYGYNILKGYPLADGRDPGFTRPIFAYDFSNKHHTADCRWVSRFCRKRTQANYNIRVTKQ